MFDFLKKGDGADDAKIVVLKKTERGMCGGTDATLDTAAPDKIESREMTLFDATSALGGGVCISPEPQTDDHAMDLDYISAFAVPAKRGTFLFLETFEGNRRYTPGKRAWALVKEDIFPALVDLVNECGLAKGNGHHSTTYGLPENFGGSVRILYASGEKISFSNNQSPIIAPPVAKKIAKLFCGAMAGERVALPDVAKLKQIRFSEERGDDGYTRAALTLEPDGTGTNRKESKYEDSVVYNSEKPVDAETVNAIKKNIENTGILAWEDLPWSGFSLSEKEIVFVFEGGEEIAVKGDRVLPMQIGGGFFNIELEMTTKH